MCFPYDGGHREILVATKVQVLEDSVQNRVNVAFIIKTRVGFEGKDQVKIDLYESQDIGLCESQDRLGWA